MKKVSFLLILIVFLGSCSKDDDLPSGDYVKLTVFDGREFISVVDNTVGFQVNKCVASYEYDADVRFNQYVVSFIGYFENFDDYFFFHISSDSEFKTGIDYVSKQDEYLDEDYPSYLDVGISGIGDYWGLFTFRFEKISLDGRVKGTAIAHSKKGDVVMTFEFDFQN
jgi:hypothetical protein